MNAVRTLLVLTLALAPILGAAGQGFTTLTALMVDLPGWEAEKADGADMSSAGMRAVTAFRSYTSGDSRFDASILYGTQAASTWMPDYKEGYKMETPEGVMEVRRVDGFLVWNMHETAGNSGGIVVLLKESQDQTGAVFAMSYEAMDRQAAMKTAQRFNWQKMKAEVARLK